MNAWVSAIKRFGRLSLSCAERIAKRFQQRLAASPRHAGLFFSAVFLVLAPAMAIEEPAYRVLNSEPPFEHRLYSGFVIAETQLTGDFDSASRTGFRRIAGYIFGDNQSSDGASRKISMTAPVTVEPSSTGWRMHFVMPSAERLESLPKPKHPDVSLRRIPEHMVAAVRFSGWTTESAIQEQTARLKVWISEQRLEIAGTPQVARYNDPFTLPWRRRNEILIPVRSAADREPR